MVDTLKLSYGEDWEVEIASIKRECVKRASEEQEKNYKDGLGNEEIEWTTKFTIMDYKKIIEQHWSKPRREEGDAFKYFQEVFAIDVGLGFNSKAEKIKWIAQFNKYRNLWAHKGTKEKGLNKDEVEFLKKVYDFFELNG